MHRVARLGTLLVAASALAAPAFALDDSKPDEKADQPGPGLSVEDLLDRIERLEDDKTRMQDEIDELRAQNGDTWLTEERASQIRMLVEDVLTDADTRTSLMDDGITAGWDNGFFLASTDGRFRLNVGGMLQTRWVWNYHDQAPKYVYGFELARTKLVFSGHVFSPDLTYKVQTDFSQVEPAGVGTPGTGTLEDAWVRWMLNSDWALRFGQFKLPFSREYLVDSANQQVLERSLVSERTNIGRSQGIELSYGGRDRTFAVALSDGGTNNLVPGQFFPTTGANTPVFLNGMPVLNVDYSITARYQQKFAGTWDQFKQFTSPPGEAFGLLWGIGGHWQRNDAHTSGGILRDWGDWVGATTDVSVQWSGANLFSALTYNYLDIPNFNVNSWGWTLQGGMYFTEKFEGYARFEWGKFIINGDPWQKDLAVVTIGGNYYFDGQDIKLSADVGFGINPVNVFWFSDQANWRIDNPSVSPQIVVRTQLQLLF